MATLTSAMFRPALVALPLLVALPAAAPPVPSEGIVTLAADAEARWIAFDLTPGNQIRFDVLLDGKPLSAILDTGGSYSLLSRRAIAAGPSRVTRGGRATAIGGMVALDWMPTASIAFGGLAREGGRISVADLPTSATGGARGVDMLVGRDLVAGQALDIDYANHRFRLIPSGRLPFTGAVAPLSVSPQRQVYESVIAIGGQRIAPVIVDTGDGSSITLANAAWNTAGLTQAVPTTTTVGYGLAGETVNTLAVAPMVTIGALTARNVELKVEPSGGFSQAVGVSGRIGSGFLQHYRVLLDPGAGRMVFQPAATADQPPLRSTSGLLTGVLPGRLRVLHVMRGSPAEAGGWQKGDEICAVDGAGIGAGYVGSAASRWSVGAPGRVVALTVCGGGVRPLRLASFY